MTDYYIKAPSYSSLYAALPTWMKKTEKSVEYLVQYDVAYALDLIGPIVITPAVTDPLDTILVPAVFDTHYHANLRLLDESLAPEIESKLSMYLIPEPAHPVREWSE